MTALRFVPADWGTHVTVTGALDHLCPVVEEVDQGEAVIEWTTGGAADTDDGNTVELHDLAALLGSYKDTKISHEDLAQEVAAALDEVPGISGVVVTLSYVTAGLKVAARVER